jgi:hypothetical protein
MNGPPAVPLAAFQRGGGTRLPFGIAAEMKTKSKMWRSDLGRAE